MNARRKSTGQSGKARAHAVAAKRRPKANGAGTYRPWNELLRRTFLIDILACPSCASRMKLLSLVTNPRSIAPYLRRIELPTDMPQKSTPRPPPYMKSRFMRRRLGHNDCRDLFADVA